MGGPKYKRSTKKKVLVRGKGIVKLKDTTNLPINVPTPTEALSTADQVPYSPTPVDTQYEPTEDLINDYSYSNTDSIHETWPYTHLQEFYQVDLQNQVHIHVMNDFEFDEYNYTQRKKGFAAVIIMKLKTNSGYQAVGCCSICFSKQLLWFYALSNHESEVLNETHLFNCRHTTAAVQKRLATDGFQCSIRNDHENSKNALSSMTPYSERLEPGWIPLNAKSNPKGRLGVYISQEYRIHVFASQKQKTGTLKHYCFQCSKYGCHHAGTITHALDGEIPDVIEPITLSVPPLDDLKSKKRYPCNFLY